MIAIALFLLTVSSDYFTCCSSAQPKYSHGVCQTLTQRATQHKCMLDRDTQIRAMRYATTSSLHRQQWYDSTGTQKPPPVSPLSLLTIHSSIVGEQLATPNNRFQRKRRKTEQRRTIVIPTQRDCNAIYEQSRHDQTTQPRH